MADHVGRGSVGEALASDRTFMTFAGIETFLLFLQQFPLREFCAFEVLDDAEHWERLDQRLLRPVADSCVRHGHGLITDALVWRASPDYLEQLGYAAADVVRVNREAVGRVRSFLADWRRESGASPEDTPAILAADIGPRGDGYRGDSISVEDAAGYHAKQIAALAETEVDLLVALTMTHVHETIGIVRAAREHGLPIGVSPTVETDGTLPDGMGLGEFIRRVDDATGGDPLFHMVNCAHPEHLAPTLVAAKEAGEDWIERLSGLRANASTRSHEELDNSSEIDRGEIDELARQLGEMHREFAFNIAGGCCGTDAEHLEAIARACAG